jgi:hypothetical protein
MKNPIKTTYKASKEVLSKKNYVIGFIITMLVVLSILIIIPVFLIPANTISFQLTVYTLSNYFLLIFLSLLISLVLISNVYIYKKNRKILSGNVAISGGSAFMAAIFGTATCASCIAAVFGFLGTGTIFLLVENQLWIAGLASLIMLTSLYFTSLKFCGGCKSNDEKR